MGRGGTRPYQVEGWDAVERVLPSARARTFRFQSPAGFGQTRHMSEGVGSHPQVGRKTPAGGAHIFLGQANIFFVTANAKDKAPWMAQPAVHSSLADVWREEAKAWLVGYYL